MWKYWNTSWFAFCQIDIAFVIITWPPCFWVRTTEMVRATSSSILFYWFWQSLVFSHLNIRICPPMKPNQCWGGWRVVDDSGRSRWNAVGGAIPPTSDDSDKSDGSYANMFLNKLTSLEDLLARLSTGTAMIWGITPRPLWQTDGNHANKFLSSLIKNKVLIWYVTYWL